MSRASLERQLEAAKQTRQKQATKLSEKGLTEKQYRSDPIWRHWNSQCRKLTRRLARVGEKETIGAGEAQGGSEEG